MDVEHLIAGNGLLPRDLEANKFGSLDILERERMMMVLVFGLLRYCVIAKFSLVLVLVL